MPKLAVGFLFDDTLDSDAGVAQYVKTLGAWLTNQGHDVSYIVGQTQLENWAGGKVYSLSKNLPVSFNGNRLSIPLPAPTKKIDKLLSEKQYDVLHVQMPHSPLMSSRVIKRVSSRTAVVGTFHILPAGKISKLGSRLLSVLYLNSLDRFDQIVSVSEPAAKFAEECYGLQSAIIPNVIDLAKFTPTVPAAKRSASIVFLGRLVQRKGAMELLEAFLMLHKWMSDARLVIAGDGPERVRLERFVKKNRLNRKVSFKGYVTEGEKPKLLAEAQVACFPALYGESFGIVLLEAMAAGSGVVVGGNNPGYRSVLGGQPELLIDPKATDSFARRLELLLNDSDLQRKLNRWQKKHVAKYDVGVVGPEILNLYRSALNRRRKR